LGSLGLIVNIANDSGNIIESIVNRTTLIGILIHLSIVVA